MTQFGIIMSEFVLFFFVEQAEMLFSLGGNSQV